MFSSRLPGALTTNAFSRAVDGLRTQGAALLDLTATNPTDVGLTDPADLLRPLADAAGARYVPAPLGLPGARAAVAADYARRGLDAPVDRIVLTASTSEAYALLFKLLCDPGDAVLVPQPSYPLFDLLTRLEGVAARPYRLEYHGTWSMDRASIEQAVTERTRALLVVTPNNPTGSMLRAGDRDWLERFCADHQLAVISDEVFADYPLSPRADACTLAGSREGLTFSLGGLSKSAGLPQVKLGWMLVGGPAPLARPALDRLELICDTYLSVSTPVQLAAPQLIAAGRAVRSAIGERLLTNLSALRRRVADHPSISLLEPEGGWSAVLQVPATTSEEALVLRLLEDAHVLVHPGYFFDFPREAFLVLSLLPEPGQFAAALDRLLPIAAGAPTS
jgi:aspartate/methionine/tyrosine aminotransferase